MAAGAGGRQAGRSLPRASPCLRRSAVPAVRARAQTAARRFWGSTFVQTWAHLCSRASQVLCLSQSGSAPPSAGLQGRPLCLAPELWETMGHQVPGGLAPQTACVFAFGLETEDAMAGWSLRASWAGVMGERPSGCVCDRNVKRSDPQELRQCSVQVSALPDSETRLQLCGCR